MKILHRYKTLLLAMCSFYVGCIITFLFMSVENGSPGDFKRTVIAKSSHDIDNKVFAVIILSSPSNSDRRKSIRQTWMTIRPKSNVLKNLHIRVLKYYFVIGKKDLDEAIANNIQAESKKHKDIILLENFKDEYKHLAAKVLSSFKWVLENIPNVEYILKCDDDSFIRVESLLEEFYKIKESQFNPKYVQPQYPIIQDSHYQDYIYWGYFYGNARVYSTGRWSDNSWFLCDRYLPYALGGGYVLSVNIVKHIVSNINVLRLYNSEDVSVGVWTAAFDVNRIHDKRFDTQWTSRGCRESHLVRHKQSIRDMQTAFSNLLRSNFTRMCTEEKSVRNPYVYNWNTLPSQCCVP